MNRPEPAPPTHYRDIAFIEPALKFAGKIALVGGWS